VVSGTVAGAGVLVVSGAVAVAGVVPVSGGFVASGAVTTAGAAVVVVSCAVDAKGQAAQATAVNRQTRRFV
jgi:hypothetical protein